MTGTTPPPQSTPAPAPGSVPGLVPGSTPGPEQLQSLLTRQRDLYQQLKSLSDQQGGLIAAGEAEQLLTLLGQRQQLVEELGVLSVEISPHRAAIASLAGDAAGPYAATLRSLVDEVRGLLGSIIEQDDAGQKELEAARDEVGGQLRRAAGAPAALGAYRGGAALAAAPAPRFTDQRG